MEQGRMRLLREYKNTNDGRRMAYFIVPEQATLVTDEWLMENMDEDCLMDVRVVSFEKLSEEVLAATRGKNRSFIDPTGKAMLLRTVFEDYKDEFQVFRSGGQNRGFLRHALRLLTELKRSDISCERLEEVSHSSTAKAVFAQKIKEVSFMQQKLEEKLCGTYFDNEDRMSLLAKELPHARNLHSVDFYFTYFNGFTGLEYEVIRSLIKLPGEVRIALPLDVEIRGEGGDNVFAASEETLRILRQIAYEEKVAVSLSHCNSSSERGETAFLAEGLFSYSKTVFSKRPEMIRLRVCQTTEEEIHLVARTIRNLLMYERARYRDVGVLVTDSAEYFKPIGRIFSLYDIPVFTDEKRELSASPVIAAIISLIECVASDFSHEALFRFLKYGFTDMERREVDILEDYVSTHKVRGTMYFEEGYFERGKLEEEERAEVLRIRSKFQDMMEGFYRDTKKKGTVRELAETLILFLLELDFPKKIDAYVDELNEAGLFSFADEHEQVWELFIGVVDQMVELVGRRRVGMKEFGEILSSGVEGHRIGIIPPAQDQVVIGTLDRSRNKQSRYLFILGLCEGYFPKHRAEISLLSQEERSQLAEGGVSLPSVAKKMQAEERLNFYLNTCSVDHTLYLSYPLSNRKGSPLRPSYYISKLKEMFPKLEEEGGETYGAEDVYSKKHLRYKLAEHLRAAVRGGEGDVVFWREALSSLMEDDPEGMEKMTAALEKKRTIRYIEADYVNKLYGDRIPFSSSRLEQFAKCPYRHFVQYALSPKQKNSYEMEASDIGTLLHASIDEFTALLKQRYLSRERVEEYRDEDMDDIFRRRAGEMLGIEFENSPRNRYLLEKLKNTARSVGKHLFRQMEAGSFVIWGQEVDFGYGKELPAIELVKDKAYLRGRIDRIDVWVKEDKLYVKIIDYKTSRKRFSLSDAWDGLDMQLLLYLFSAMYSRSLGGKDRIPAGVFYFPAVNSLVRAEEDQDILKIQNDKWLMRGIALKDEGVLQAIDRSIEEYSSVFYGNGRKKYNEKENLLEEKEFERLIDHVMDLSKGMAREILRGKMEVSPVYRKPDDTACTYCPYRGICRFDERSDDAYRQIVEKKDEEVKALLAGEEEGDLDE